MGIPTVVLEFCAAVERAAMTTSTIARNQFFISFLLENHARRDLDLTWARPFRGLDIGYGSKWCGAVIEVRRGVVRVIECVGCRGPYLKSNTFGDVYGFEQRKRHG